MNEKNTGNDVEKDDKDYALYTEKIVQSPKVKYKKYINGIRIVGIVALTAVLLTFFFRFVMPWYSANFPLKPEDRDEWEIEKDEYGVGSAASGSESLTLSPKEDPDAISELDDYESVMAALRSRVTEIKKSVVAIDSSFSGVNQLTEEGSSETETSGLVVGCVNSEYLIVAKASSIDSFGHVVVRFSTKEEITGTVKSVDTHTDIAIISINALDMSYTMIQSIKIAILDNSYNVHQGDLFLAYGKLYGQNNAVAYGTITEISARVGTDNTFEIFNTNLSFEEGDSSFIFNVNGNVIGISTSTTGDKLKIRGISDLKALIEAMANKGGYVYFGIHGTNVNASMEELYSLPMGIYISEVEIDSPAYDAGLQAGDVICGIDGESVLTIQSFSEKLYQYSDGQTMLVKAMRKGKDEYYDVKFYVTVRNAQP